MISAPNAVTGDDALVDLIYEAAVVPDHWPRVLDLLCELSGSVAGGLVSVDADAVLRGIATARYDPVYRAFLDSGREYRNLRAERAMRRGHAGFLRDVDLCTPEELAEDPIYRHFLAPAGLGWTLGTLVPVPTLDLLIFDFAREAADGPHEESALERLDGYRPHLARAAMISARLGLDRADAATRTLAALGLPAAVLSDADRVLAVNDAFLGLGADFEIGIGDRLLAPLEGTTATGGRRMRSRPIAARDDRPALIVHDVPLRRDARDFFAGADRLLVVTPVTAPAAPAAGVLSGLFDLTAAETRLARALAEGATLEGCAHTFGVSIETVRSQLKAILAKTGTHRQSDLVRLLVGAVATRFAG